MNLIKTMSYQGKVVAVVNDPNGQLDESSPIGQGIKGGFYVIEIKPIAFNENLEDADRQARLALEAMTQ